MYPLSTETQRQGPYKTQKQGPSGPCLEFSCIIFSGVVELLQSEYFNRSGDWIDFVANSLGALLGIPLAVLIVKVFGERRSRPERENVIEHNEL